ncbi:MAG: hypothetical protein Kow00108_16960 [Calditrichia bacterium]
MYTMQPDRFMKDKKGDIMEGKICCVTGANSGIGFAIAKKMAEMGFTVVMICRRLEAGEKARNEIIQLTGNKNIDLFIVDLSSQTSIRQFVYNYEKKISKIGYFV